MEVIIMGLVFFCKGVCEIQHHPNGILIIMIMIQYRGVQRMIHVHLHVGIISRFKKTLVLCVCVYVGLGGGCALFTCSFW